MPQGLVQFVVPYYARTVLVVDKDKKQISVWKKDRDSSQAQRLLTFSSNVGKKRGDKLKEGDFKTPEGIYFFTQRFIGKELPSYELYGSLGFDTNYPNFFDLRKGKTGTGIWLHGIPESQVAKEGSRGCVILNDKDIHALKEYIHLHRTPFLIYASVPMVHKSEVRKLRKQLNKMIKDWQFSWENKNLDMYMSFYDTQFQSQRKNWSQWREYKKGLMEQYQFIKLSLTQPLILYHASGIIVKTLQQYESNAYSDFGEKTLYLVEREKEFKIVGEEWKSLDEKPSLYFSLNQHEKNLPLPPPHLVSKPLSSISLQTDRDGKDEKKNKNGQ